MVNDVNSGSRLDPLLVVLLGPTASGKTALSLQLAQRFSGEIISCDSVAVYRDMEIGTSKPSPASRALVPHHLIDVVTPDTTFSAGDFSRLARESLARIKSHGHLPIVTGGTGLYLRALIDGLFAGPQRSESLRERLRVSSIRHGQKHLHGLLIRLDPTAAAAIHCNDTPKLIRAIEISLTAGQPRTEAWAAGRERLDGYRILRIGLDPDRPALYARINARATAMFDDGLIEETAGLLDRYRSDCPAFDSLGYRQARAALRGELTRAQAVAAAQQGHRNYSKRQLTWFRREPDVHWLRSFGDAAASVRAAAKLIEAAL